LICEMMLIISFGREKKFRVGDGKPVKSLMPQLAFYCYLLLWQSVIK
jgi:hypothetical protein